METFANALKAADAFIWGPPLLILLLELTFFTPSASALFSVTWELR